MNAGIRILLVEDEASLRRSLTKYLERAGYTFECCATAREALALAERIDPDIVIAEYHLPDANGAVLLKKLMWMLPDVSVILLSEYEFQDIAKDLTHVTVRSILKKPFDLVEFEAALSSARSKTKFMPLADLEGEREFGFEGILGFTSK